MMALVTQNQNFGISLSMPNSTLAIPSPVKEAKSLFKPLLSDDHKVGFFSSDRQVQTSQSEIIELKELSDVVEQLLEDSATMRREIKFARGVMQAEFDSKLQKKALELYRRINDKTTDIEKIHLERVGTIRRAFKQQLADALRSVQNVFNKNTEAEKRQAQKLKAKEGEKWEAKIKELQQIIQQNDSVISMLKLQINQIQEQHDTQRKTSISIASSSNHSQELTAAREEVEELSAEVDRIQKELSKAHHDIDSRDNRIDRLEKQLEEANEKMSSEAKVSAQLQKEKGELLQTATNAKDTNKEELDVQRAELEKEFKQKLKALEEHASSEMSTALEIMKRENSEAMNKVQEENRIMEELLAKERASKKSAKSAEKSQFDRLRHNEQRALQTIAKLKEDIERVNKTWEKKFEVLQRSMYALKDESYLRQTLLKQSAQLHQASISYASEPVRRSPAKFAPPMPVKKDLHVEGKKAKPAEPQDDAISYTVSVPSGRATTTFSVDENEVLSDVEDQDIDPEFQILPMPTNPSRGALSVHSNPSRGSSAKSQVNVVMPKT